MSHISAHLLRSGAWTNRLMLWTEALELLRRMGGSESVCTPDSVQADEPPCVTIPLGRRLLDGSCGLPGFDGRAALTLLDLAPGGVCRATRVTPGAGALLPHRFTLTCARRTGPSAVCSLLHCPAGRPDWVLPSTVPCGVRTFLGPIPPHDGPVRGHPTNSLPWPSLGRWRRGHRDVRVPLPRSL